MFRRVMVLGSLHCGKISPDSSDIVCKIIVDFPKKNSWTKLKHDYFKKKELYKLKYPLDQEFEFFSNPYEDGDGYELKAVHQDKCRYTSFYLAVGGYIIVEIDKAARVRVLYEDRENIKTAQSEFEQSAFDDI